MSFSLPLGIDFRYSVSPRWAMPTPAICPTYRKGGCRGCMDEHRTGDCYTRDCVLEQGIDACGACEKFPCDTIMTRPHTTVLDRDWLRWKTESKTNH